MMNHITLFLILIAVNFNISSCEIPKSMMPFLGVVKSIISKAAIPENISRIEEQYTLKKRPLDCADLYKMGYKESGVYAIWPITISFSMLSMKRLYVYCDMTTNGGGWTVIQRRGDFKRDNDFFGKNWQQYRLGFGSIRKDFWLGNDNIFTLTNQKIYSVRFDMAFESNEKVDAEYDLFWIDDELNDYMLHISDYSGTAGNAMKNLDKTKFSTKDRDNGSSLTGKCAKKYNCGWWFKNCADANLNGRYNEGINGMWWLHMGKFKSVIKSEIKIRPIFF